MTDTSPRSATSRPAPPDPAAASVVEPSPSSRCRRPGGPPAIPQEDLLEEPRRSRLPAAIRAMRPRQWVKNVLVFTAPLAAGRLFERDVLLGSALAFVAFCLMSATVYLINDVRDVEEDRLHPRKRFRPIAAGELRPQAAVVPGRRHRRGRPDDRLPDHPAARRHAARSTCCCSWATPRSSSTCRSSTWRWSPPASCCAPSPAAWRATSSLSQWFLLVAAFGSFFMVAGKRYSEIKSLGSGAGTRKSLERYSESYLRFAWMLAAMMVLISYSLWAFTNGGVGRVRDPVDGDLDRALHPRAAPVRARGRRRERRASRRRSSCTTGSCR